MSRASFGRLASRIASSLSGIATIGEVFHPDPSVTSFSPVDKNAIRHRFRSNNALRFPLYFTLRDVLVHGTSAGQIAEILRHDSLYNRSDSLITFFGNHASRVS